MQSTRPEPGMPTLAAAALANKAPKSGRPSRLVGRIFEHAAVACLFLGALAILKASMMERVWDAVFCLAGSIGACTLVCYLYFQRD